MNVNYTELELRILSIFASNCTCPKTPEQELLARLGHNDLCTKCTFEVMKIDPENLKRMVTGRQ